MFSHVMIGANDMPASKKFYDAIFGAIGVAEGANGGTIGFLVDSPGAMGRLACGRTRQWRHHA
jgi:catechol 2,3-dioxygenase-like lactoylglutathione lyase family enzyme